MRGERNKNAPFLYSGALAPKSLGSRISVGALATTAHALRIMGHMVVKFRWTTPDIFLAEAHSP